ncbi:IS110 family transposase [Dyadobacter frigoris]|uniref:IS110 family transposase n=1 Tax=Dyadobacter frigoris TaxID=2576211 RepID=A0A4U6CX51_9BACT|nr:IS110 family transposase [Dyadobacter frigoris]TKT85984.1 IS110 family transposase [Dyadobacter frigoris]
MKNDNLPKTKRFVEMALVNPNAAGIDIGDTIHAVAVPIDRDTECVRTFGAFTCDLKAIVAWLRQCEIDTVALESTGVYWKNLFSMLVQNGFEVYLVNARQTRNITGKKTDESDAQWIQRLHSCGLLSSSFLPDDKIESLRTLVRHRRNLSNDSSSNILRMQKSLELMNLKIHTVISDLTGKTGTAIVEAIINGERNPENFLPLVDSRIKADSETIRKSLEGNWRIEHLFLLKQSYTMYQFIRQQITVCENEIEGVLQQLVAQNNDGIIEKFPIPSTPSGRISKRKKTKNQPVFNTREYLKRIHQTDVMEIYGVSETVALEATAETGTDLSKWATEEKFVSWLNLCPNRKISGGKLISSKVLKKRPNLAAQAFRIGANSLKSANNWLGDYFRRMKAKGGNKYAIVATARKIAIIYYRMVRYKQKFHPFDLEEYKEKFKLARIATLERALKRLKTEAA